MQGYGGYKNKAGVIVGPNLYKGVSVLALLDDVGGLPAGRGIKVTASDGYAASFTYEQVNGIGFNMYDPRPATPITHDHRGPSDDRSPTPRMGAPSAPTDGPLRSPW